MSCMKDMPSPPATKARDGDVLLADVKILHQRLISVAVPLIDVRNRIFGEQCIGQGGLDSEPEKSEGLFPEMRSALRECHDCVAGIEGVVLDLEAI